MTTVQTPWNQFYRTVVQPWWCVGSVLKAPGNLRSLALEGKVGKHNLYWWLYTGVQPTSQEHNWVNFIAPHLMIEKRTIIEHASFGTQREWHKLVREYAPAMELSLPMRIKFADLAKRSL